MNIESMETLMELAQADALMMVKEEMLRYNNTEAGWVDLSFQSITWLLAANMMAGLVSKESGRKTWKAMNMDAPYSVGVALREDFFEEGEE